MKSKKLLYCMVVSIFMFLLVFNSFSSEQPLVGDVNGDNSINSTDYSLMKRYLLGIIDEFPVEDSLMSADTNGDGKINSTDYALLRRYILDIIDEFPKETTTSTPVIKTQNPITTQTPITTQAPTPVITPTKPKTTSTPVEPNNTIYPDWDREHTSYATFTGSGYSGGASLLDPIPSDMEITALNPEDYNSYGVEAALAGAYLEVTGEKGSTIVFVNDLYPEGAPGALDLCPTSFGKIDEMAKGKIDISWHIVPGPVTGNFSYQIKEGSTQAWLAIQVRNHKYPVLKMEYNKGGTWVNMDKIFWNHFVTTGVDTATLEIRITDIRGVVVTDIVDGIPAPGDTGPSYIIEGNVQFPD